MGLNSLACNWGRYFSGCVGVLIDSGHTELFTKNLSNIPFFGAYKDILNTSVRYKRMLQAYVTKKDFHKPELTLAGKWAPTDLRF